MTARAVGWELSKKTSAEQPAMEFSSKEVEGVVRKGKAAAKDDGPSQRSKSSPLRHITLNNLQKVLRYRGASGVKELSRKAEQYMVSRNCV
jgi:hypothetical protein